MSSERNANIELKGLPSSSGAWKEETTEDPDGTSNLESEDPFSLPLHGTYDLNRQPSSKGSEQGPVPPLGRDHPLVEAVAPRKEGKVALPLPSLHCLQGVSTSNTGDVCSHLQTRGVRKGEEGEEKRSKRGRRGRRLLLTRGARIEAPDDLNTVNLQSFVVLLDSSSTLLLLPVDAILAELHFALIKQVQTPTWKYASPPSEREKEERRGRGRTLRVFDCLHRHWQRGALVMMTQQLQYLIGL